MNTSSLKQDLGQFFESSPEKMLLCGPTDYIHIDWTDAGFGGTYRNIQMQFSYLHTIPLFHKHLSDRLFYVTSSF